ncbi:hypothetical protein TcasGA2_TC034947 [Tribolium castaneum]|uniref:Uncharacterized protein n=1 Tax=Tribolium castaneum TaxID=7070 RepID=A0A139W9Z2_TRICA|nr:hypothetical protein TcasGA2_TC034947 [Tribolium castaneum]
MATIRKLATFRQLSLDCELDQRRKSLKKQLSEEKTRHERPQPVRIAWADSPSPKDEGIVARKCLKEAKKAPKLSRHSSLEKDSILYSKQELAERLRQALKEREKPNLDIFLAHNTQVEEEVEPPDPKQPPKIIQPLTTPSDVFQIKKNKSSAIVVIPVVEDEPPSLEDAPEGGPQDPKAIKNVIIRPATAASKREKFQKRSNTAFNSVIRPPLVRSSSAPTSKSDQKPKFLATKRKIKSGKVKGKTSDDEDSGSNKENPKNKKEMNRYVAISGSDIVTMVSLISPAASDTEDLEIELKPKIKTSPAKTPVIKKDEKEQSKPVSLRKPSNQSRRRGSMATTIMVGNALKNQKNQEKRATNSTPSEDEDRGPKRRLVRSATDKTQKSEDVKTEPEPDIKIDIKTKIVESPPLEIPEATEAEKTEPVDDQPKFGSVKEKECWEMYCKMADRGLKVSYDTILRGMLTPTEYRMRRKESITALVNETTQ